LTSAIVCQLCKKETYKGKLKLVEDIEMCYICYARLIEMGEIY